jgi:lipoate-protein ligase A
MASERWRVVGPTRATARDALAAGVARLDALGATDPVTVTWWDVDRDTLVLGRGSRVVVDANVCAARGIPVVRRTSGGGPVLWRQEHLALDVHVPRDHALHSDGVVDSYRWLGEAIVAGLAATGVDTELMPPELARERDRRDLAPLACYAGVSPWEASAAHHKVVGLSQVRRRGGVMLQAGILATADQAELAELLVLSTAEREALRNALSAPQRPLFERDATRRAIMDTIAVAVAEA